MNSYIEELITHYSSHSLKKRYDLIEENNKHVLEILKRELKDDNEINIVAKGPSCKYIANAHAINQGIIFTNKKYLYLNDIHSLFGIEHLIKDIKFVFFPDYPHINCRSNQSVTYLTVIKYLKKYNFNGNVFIYKIQTSPSKFLNNYFINVSTSTDVPMNLLSLFLNKKIFHTYGWKRGRGYHSDLFEKVYKDKAEEREKSYRYIAEMSNISTKFASTAFLNLENAYKKSNFKIIKPLDKGKLIRYKQSNQVFIH